MIARRFSLLRQLAWAATLAAGFGALWLVLVLWLASPIQEAWWGGHLPPYETLVVRSDGTLLIESVRREKLSEVTYRDLKGQVQEAPVREEQLPAVPMSGEQPNPGNFPSRLGWGLRLMEFVNEQEPTVNWFFVHDGNPDGAGYFVAYERTSNRRVGFLGMSGFRVDPVPKTDWIPASPELKSSIPFSSIYSGRAWSPRADRWDVPPRWVYVPSGAHLRKVDLAARTVTTVFETPEPIVAPGVPWLANWTTGHATKERTILVRTTRHIHELDLKHHVLRVFTIPTEADRRSSVQWFGMDSSQAIAVFTPSFSAGEPDSVSKLKVYRIASDGVIQDQFELGLQTGSVPKKVQDLVGVLGLPAPAILFALIPVIEVGINQIKDYPAGLEALLKNTWPEFSVVLALSLILAVLAWRRGRAFGLAHKERITWTVFVLLLGLPAFVGFRLYRRWPIRQPCTTCHANVPRDRLACAECGVRFPDPSLKGIEIFA